ncbi:unnamed protein product [Danaus chrysippus]|uniref:(African queen) hypothetical protein n=1 Tax=Danaus chrysippus TaxID=151541 RepID=A0A8J2QK35_9NEOP|nr:unnamed protein product [Danaus chrysippus]
MGPRYLGLWVSVARNVDAGVASRYQRERRAARQQQDLRADLNNNKKRKRSSFSEASGWLGRGAAGSLAHPYYGNSLTLTVLAFTDSR